MVLLLLLLLLCSSSSSSSCVHLGSHNNSNIVLQSSLDAACGHAGGSIIRTDAAAARSLDKMATDATDFAQDRHTHGHRHRHRREHTRDRERHGQTQRDRERHGQTQRDRERHGQTQRDREKERKRQEKEGTGWSPKKNPPKKTCTQKKKRGSLGFRV